MCARALEEQCDKVLKKGNWIGKSVFFLGLNFESMVVLMEVFEVQSYCLYGSL